ncbi:hypothetical protein NQ314_009446 [Rhamnusium bicolor]|uniref:Uncharacterized protein n=1 Tax=Rhamnusium bicolor TaxID=1586634 RepID=A0AAV8Y249_9CUCU|nr:hypothetical protein NQ314_009446 [Rhamnusium bicolor]
MWYHVQGQYNLADLLSRGLSPEKIYNCPMWWQGPSWLSQPRDSWPNSNFQILEHVPEVKKKVIISKVTVIYDGFPFNRFSNLNRLKRTVAYCLRFISNCKSREGRLTGPLTISELGDAMHCVVRVSQADSFSSELQHLQNKQKIKTKGCLSGLNPFIDSHGIIRVGGRINLSQLDYEKKHPILISAKHVLTSLFFSFEHHRLLHAGPQLLLYSIREKFWPLGGRNLARKTIYSSRDVQDTYIAGTALNFNKVAPDAFLNKSSDEK